MAPEGIIHSNEFWAQNNFTQNVEASVRQVVHTLSDGVLTADIQLMDLQ